MIIGSTAPFSQSSVLVGAARGIIEDFITFHQDQQPEGEDRPVGGEHLQILVGTCWSEIDAAWQLIQSDVNITEACLKRDKSIPRHVAIRNRAHNTLTTKLILSALDRLYGASGSSILSEKSPSGRLYQDVKAGTQHVAVNQTSGARDAGFMLLNPDMPWSYPLPS
ncbi:hypothetical protein [Pseudovibrio sp. WM33]|uniref:hypothetical protein n=1 Tax=Pseudovibrio sp. WM33 TaxID=1735585 RepID=UPI0007B2DEC2|nr:hypothetical protein [Pseudovibrio sp. WM33]KZL24677.1 Flavin-dependent monooxygenase, oxygenase subunit HsaA [Pseudovibrio sp. WM33]